MGTKLKGFIFWVKIAIKRNPLICIFFNLFWYFRAYKVISNLFLSFTSKIILDGLALLHYTKPIFNVLMIVQRTLGGATLPFASFEWVLFI